MQQCDRTEWRYLFGIVSVRVLHEGRGRREFYVQNTRETFGGSTGRSRVDKEKEEESKERVKRSIELLKAQDLKDSLRREWGVGGSMQRELIVCDERRADCDLRSRLLRSLSLSSMRRKIYAARVWSSPLRTYSKTRRDLIQVKATSIAARSDLFSAREVKA